MLSRRVMDPCSPDRVNSPDPGDPLVGDMDLGEATLPAGTCRPAGTAVLEVSVKKNTEA